jgi:peroxiredoxin
MKRTAVCIILSLFITAAFAQQKPEGLFINSKAPDFVAKDQGGNTVSLKELRKKGNVVLIFYRGNWCPFCNKQLKDLQDSLGFITAKGAQLVAVTPEAAGGIDSTIAKTGASFPIIFDQGMKIADGYAVSFNVEERVVNRYKSIGIDLLKANNQRVATLPVPAVYIISKDGSVTYRYFDENYRRRVSVKEILANLR